MIEAVLFDYGGVLTDGGKEGSTDRAVAEFFGVEVGLVDIDDLHDRFGSGQISADEFIAELNQRYGQVKKMSGEYYAALNSDIYQPRSSIHDFAVKLRSHNIRTGILSNINGLIAEPLAEAGGYNGFDPLILSHEVGLRKPGLEIYELALGELALKPEVVVFIDDKPKNLEPARRLGMITVHASSEKQLNKGLPALFKRSNGIDLKQLD